MSRTHAMRTHDLGPAVYLLLALFLALRCTGAWAVPLPPAQSQTQLAAQAAHAHPAAAAVSRRTLAKVEAVVDGPSPPSSAPPVQIRWPTVAALAGSQPGAAMVRRAPAPPPPARGPPSLRA